MTIAEELKSRNFSEFTWACQSMSHADEPAILRHIWAMVRSISKQRTPHTRIKGPIHLGVFLKSKSQRAALIATTSSLLLPLSLLEGLWREH